MIKYRYSLLLFFFFKHDMVQFGHCAQVNNYLLRVFTASSSFFVNLFVLKY